MSESSRPFTALILLWLAGNSLRLPILAIPPVLALIQADLRLSGTEIGVLTGLPVILFAVAAVPGSLLIARVGAVPAPRFHQPPPVQRPQRPSLDVEGPRIGGIITGGTLGLGQALAIAAEAEQRAGPEQVRFG